MGGLVLLLFGGGLFTIEVNGGPAPYRVQTLDNGLDVVSLRSAKVPLITIVIACKAGGFTETPETNGLTHLWEHMFFKGNQTLPRQEDFKRRVRQLGMSFNGDTSAEKVRYYVTMPSVFLREGVKFMFDAIATPKLDETELAKERQVVMDEYDRAAANPAFDFYTLTRRLIYGELDYLRDPLGLRPLLAKASRKQLLAIKEQVFVPRNCAVLLSGDFDDEALDETLRGTFGTWKQPEAWAPVQPPPFPPFPKTTSFVMTRPAVQNASVAVTFRGPRARHEPEATFAADVLISLLKQPSGRFYREFVDSGLTFGSGLYYRTQSQAGELTLYAETQPNRALDVRKRLQQLPASLLKRGYFTQEQLQDVQRGLLVSHKRSLNQPSGYIKVLASWWATSGLDYYAGYLDNLRKISLSDIRKFITEFMHKKPHIASILMSPEAATQARVEENASPLVAKHLQHYYPGPAAPKEEKPR